MPENTLPGFRKALELGVTTLEMDVVISADREVVVSHDPWFSASICTKPDGTPVTEAEEQSLKLYHMTYEEIARYDCGSRAPEEL
jgi:glycerophosphoryl diester phosphodiesterase